MGLESAELKLDPESVKEIVRGSILRAIDEQAQERLIAAAIDYLMSERKTGSYGEKTAPIDEIFNQAVQQAAREVVFNSFRDDPRVQEAIGNVVHPVIKKLAEDNYDGLPEKIGEAFGQWIKEQRTQY